MDEPTKKMFVLTGYVQQHTCNCGCVSHNTFWQDHGFGGTAHLAGLQYCDQLSGAKDGCQGTPVDRSMRALQEAGRLRNQPSDPADDPEILEGSTEHGDTEDHKRTSERMDREFRQDLDNGDN